MIQVSKPSVGEEELEAIRRVFATGWLGMGSVVKEFEDRVADLLSARHVIAVCNGTAALHLAVEALRPAPGAEVIVPSLTYAASIQAILAAGARPVFCEVDPGTLNVDLADVERRFTERTLAVMPVHYRGLACAMDELLALAHARGARVVEDAAHAFASSYRGRFIGGFGDLTCFSFDPIKNVTCGEGGAVTTPDDELAGIIRRKRILGIDKDTWSRYQNRRNWFYEVVEPGWRYHMSNISAAIGLAQLDKMEGQVRRRRAIVGRYEEAFAGLEGFRPFPNDAREMVPFIYMARVPARRDALMDHLKEKGVASGINYIPCHLQPFFREFGTGLEATEKLFEEIITIPLYVDMTEGEVETVITAVLSFFGGGE